MAPVGAALRDGGDGLDIELRIVIEDRPFQLLQLPPRLDAKFADQNLPGVPIDLECLRLPSRAVQREHELGPRALAQGLPLDERLELRHELLMLAESEICIDAVFECHGAALLEPRDLRLGERLVAQVTQRWATPDRESLPERV